jgi:hypothetical protein
MKQDLDDFLAHHIEKYYSTVKSVIQAQAPGVLLLGSSPLGSWGAPPRKELLQVASKYLDVYTFGNIPPFICSNCNDGQERIEFAAQYGGDKPWINWEGFQAKSDSYWNVAASGSDAVKTQAQRGQLYQQMVNQLLNAKDSSGTYHVVGFQWWELYDNRAEKANWGIVTRRDNAYDGVQARRTTGKDQWGFPIGGEQQDYGDVISAITSANMSVYGTSSAGTGISTTSVAFSPDSVTAGQAVTFSATVTGDIGAPTGTIRFFDGTVSLGSALLNSGSASITTLSLAAGSHSITANYSGSSAYAGSQSTALVVNVNPGPVRLSIASSANPSASGQVITFTATISGGAGTPAGTVRFLDDVSLLGSARLSSSSASSKTATLGVGTHPIKAVFTPASGDPDVSSPALNQLVNEVVELAAGAVVVTSSANPSALGQSVTITATVGGNGATPTGTVQFFDGNTWLGVATLTDAGASLTVSGLTVGNHLIGAAYSGDSNYKPNASDPYMHVVAAQTNGGILVRPMAAKPASRRFDID